MLTASYNSQPIQAADAPTNGAFRCLVCGDPVTLKRGVVRIAHFAHAAGHACEFTSGETEEHRRAKLGIFQGLLADPRASNVQLEHYLETCRPDVYFEREGTRVAIEVQRSDITIETVQKRTKRYSDMGMAVLWVFVTRRQNLHAWQKYIQVANYGRCYFWLTGQIVVPTHYDGHDHVFEALPAPICGGFSVNARPTPWTGKLPRTATPVMIPPSIWWKDIQRGAFWPTKSNPVEVTRATWRWQMYNLPEDQRVSFDQWLSSAHTQLT